MSEQKQASRMRVRSCAPIEVGRCGFEIMLSWDGPRRKRAVVSVSPAGLRWRMSPTEDRGGISWDELFGQEAASEGAVSKGTREFLGRKKKGEITPHEVFCRPILEALAEMGGRGRAKAVLDRVGSMMKDVLQSNDYARVPSAGKQLRWRVSAMFARNVMANNDGRMKDSSPYGVWEISDAGRSWLKTS